MSASPRPSAGVRRCLRNLLAAIGGLVVLLGVGAQVASAAPAYDVEPPEVELAPGNRLHCDPGSWEGIPGNSNWVYTWLRDGSAFESGVGDSTYELNKTTDKGHIYTCIVYGFNSEGGEEEESWNAFEYGKAEVERPEPPASIEMSGNAKAGEAKVGETLECKRGNWKGRPAPTFTYEWLREGVAIPAVASTTYMVREEDGGYSLSCRVTGTNSVGSVQKQSNSLKVPGTAPSNVTPPQVLPKGTGSVGEQATCAPEKWKGQPPPTFTYQWLRSGVAIAGATGTTYTIETADLQHSITCRVLAKNGSGEAKAESSDNVEVPGTKPGNLEPPKVTGTGAVGSKLTCEKGTWSGVPSPSYQYQWLRSGTAISVATLSTYTVVSEDAGKFISCEVTATNTYGSASEASKAVKIEGAPTNSVPINEKAPAVTGEPIEGKTLSCSIGVWYAEPPATYSYEWLRAGAPISGATNSSYTVAAADRGLPVICRVTARNTEGTGRADSEPIQIKGTKPTIGPPGISRGAHAGRNAHVRSGIVGRGPQAHLQLPLAARWRSRDRREQLRSPEERQRAPSAMRHNGDEHRRERLRPECGTADPGDPSEIRGTRPCFGSGRPRTARSADVQQQVGRGTRTFDHIRVADRRRADRRGHLQDLRSD